jgi:hypothetical protein
VVSLNESKIAAELTARIVKLAVEPGQRIAPRRVDRATRLPRLRPRGERAQAATKAAKHAPGWPIAACARAKLVRRLHQQGWLDIRAAERDTARADVGGQRGGVENRPLGASQMQRARAVSGHRAGTPGAGR